MFPAEFLYIKEHLQDPGVGLVVRLTLPFAVIQVSKFRLLRFQRKATLTFFKDL